MPADTDRHYTIRRARAEELPALGQLLVHAYASLPGMPRIDQQPEYYQMLSDVARRAGNPGITVLAAVGDSGEILGCVDFIEDMTQYGTAGAASRISDAAGVRLLAVSAEHRGKGIGRALTQSCIERARSLGRSAVVLHTTRVMQVAWKMYESIGFERFPEIDFRQGNLDVFGFRISLARQGS